MADPVHRPCEDASRNGVGHGGFVAGVVAVLFLFVPIIGDFVTVPAGALALALGAVGYGRVSRGTASNTVEATLACLLGGLAALGWFLSWLAGRG